MRSEPVRVEIITGRERRRHYTTNDKFALADATMQSGITVSAVACLNGVSASPPFKWRQLMSQGGQVAVKADEDVAAASRARELEQRVREPERFHGRKAMEVEVLQEPLVAARGKGPSGGVAQSNLVDQMSRTPERRGLYRREGDDNLLVTIRQLTGAIPT